MKLYQSYPEDINTDITPTEFELLVKDYLMNLGKDLKTLKVAHNVKIERIDGEYQIDVLAEFNYLGANFRVLIECKKHKSSIKRDVPQLLYDKLRATGAQKGIIFSTSGFQEGAILFAQQHGIALIRVIESHYAYITLALGSQKHTSSMNPDKNKYIGVFKHGYTTTYLQENYFDSLADFLFNEDKIQNDESKD